MTAILVLLVLVGVLSVALTAFRSTFDDPDTIETRARRVLGTTLDAG